jgi:sRNA-binding regulator protein Hfq
MQSIVSKIESLKDQLKTLEDTYAKSFNSIKKEYSDWQGFRTSCKHILYLFYGKELHPYSTNDMFTLYEASSKNWCRIYKNDEDIGFIAKPTGLFEASSEYHKAFWVNWIRFQGFTESFETFCKMMKEDEEFLKKAISYNCTKPQMIFEKFKNPFVEPTDLDNAFFWIFIKS